MRYNLSKEIFKDLKCADSKSMNRCVKMITYKLIVRVCSSHLILSLSYFSGSLWFFCSYYLQVIQQSQKAGALIRPPQVTLTQTPMVALRQPHSRIMLTTPQIQLNQLQTGKRSRYLVYAIFGSIN